MQTVDVRQRGIEFARTWGGSIVLFPLCVYFCINRGDYTLLDSADLVIHEAGHFFFRFFGMFMHVAGGTLMQIILPSIIAWYFFRNDYTFGTQMGLLWLGHNLINISVYSADARARILPLLGGDGVIHDWSYLLGRMGLLEYDQVIGYMFLGLAVLVFLILLILPHRMW